MLNEPSTPKMFRSEYEIEMEQWLQRRFRYLCYAYLIYEALKLFVTVLRIGLGDIRATVIHAIAAAISLGIVIWYLRVARWEHESRDHVVRMATWMILLLGGISLVSLFSAQHWQEASPNVIGSLFLWHLTACIFLPWTPRESLRPMLPLFAIWVIGTILTHLGPGWWAWGLFSIAICPFILAPGLVICWWRLHRHGREFRRRMIGKHFWSMREEFQRARTIHESMFPQPIRDDSIRFDYSYSPMTEIGGDYLHLHMNDEGVAYLTLIDVTGHGLVAALTVNRLFGELERIRAESPNAEPCDVLTLLNRYFYLTLQRHTIYATAISVMLDPNVGQLKWCNAGHPPAYLRGANGQVHDLGATETLLGVQKPDDFDSTQRSVDLSPGDVVVAYTDGAFEARDRQGNQFGIQQLRSLLSNRETPRNWPQFIAAAIDKHTNGRNDDDVLIAALVFEGMRSGHTHDQARQPAERH